MGLPIEPGLRSQKMKLWVKGTMTTGTQGFGFVAGTMSWAADSSNVYVTDATYAGQVVTDTAAGVTGMFPNSPYAASLFSATNPGGVCGRAVAGGIRVRYIGTELNRGGQILALEHPDHNSMVNMTLPDMLAFPEAHLEAVDRSWHTVHWTHVWPGEETFTNTTEPAVGPVETHNRYPIMAIAVQAPSGVQGLFEFESYTLVEFIGSPSSAYASPTTTHNQKTNVLKQKLAQLTTKQKLKLSKAPVQAIEKAGLNLLRRESPTIAKYAESATPILEDVGEAAGVALL